MFKTKHIYRNKIYKTNFDRPKLSDLIDAVNWFRKSYRHTLRKLRTKKTQHNNSVKLQKHDRQYKNVESCTISSSSDAHDSGSEETSSINHHDVVSSFEKSPGSREHHNLLEKQRREIMRRLLKLLRDILPSHYCQERMSTSKTLQQASYFIKDGDVQLQKCVELCNELVSERNHLRDLAVKYFNAYSSPSDSPESEMSKASSDKISDEKDFRTDYDCDVYGRQSAIHADCLVQAPTD